MKIWNLSKPNVSRCLSSLLMKYLIYQLYFSVMLQEWFIADQSESQVRKWEENEDIVSWFEEQKAENSLLNKNIEAVKKDAFISLLNHAFEVINQAHVNFLG